MYKREIYYTSPLFKATSDAYSLCIAGLILSFFTIIATLIFALWYRNKARNTIFFSHFTYVIFGCFYYTLALVGCIGILLWTYQQSFFIHGRFFTPLLLCLFFGTAPFIWWIIRFLRGIKLLHTHQPVSNAYTIWFAK